MGFSPDISLKQNCYRASNHLLKRKTVWLLELVNGKQYAAGVG